MLELVRTPKPIQLADMYEVPGLQTTENTEIPTRGSN